MNVLNITYSNNRNCKLLTLQDGSAYSTLNPILNTIIEIKAPGKDCYTIFNLLPGWCSKTFTCVDFDLCCINDDISILPDGIYEIKYSIDPNLVTIIEIQHLRVCQLMSGYINTICKYLSKKCNLGKKERLDLEKELSSIKDTIDSAIYAVEECFDIESGMELYNEASIRIKNLNNGKSCLCS